MGLHENTFSENDLWCTPPEVLDPIYEHFGGISLDPFGSPNGLVQASTYMTVHGAEMSRNPNIPDGARILHGDSLKRDWVTPTVRVGPGPHALGAFCNGPFSVCKRWTEKVYWEAQRGVESISLLPVRTGSVYWQTFVCRSDAILFWKGRLKFVGAKDPAPFHCALSYFGDRVETFIRAFPDHWYIAKS